MTTAWTTPSAPKNPRNLPDLSGRLSSVPVLKKALPWGLRLTVGLALVLTSACTKPTLYSQIGGEIMLTAVALEVSRDENLQDLVKRGSSRIFRQRLYEVLCAATGGPCDLPETPRFVIEMQLNQAERERVAQSLEVILDTLSVHPDLSRKLLRNSGLRSRS